MLRPAEVRDAYLSLLGRHPESEAMVAECIDRYVDSDALLEGIRNSPEYRERIGGLETAYALTDGYQPAYGRSTLSQSHSRPTDDRCEAISRFVLGELGAGTLAHLSVLDVGCAQGYASLYFASRGAHVAGVDPNPANIAFCRALARASGIGAVFEEGRFGDDAAVLATRYGVNAVLLLSVLHHVTHAEGQESVKQGVARLLDQGAVLFCELAHVGEAHGLGWRASQPADPLSVLPPGCEVRPLGDFSALGGNAVRTLYAAWSPTIRYRPFWPANDTLADWTGAARSREMEATMPALRFSTVTNVPVRNKSYLWSGDLFAKTVRFAGASAVDQQRALVGEAMVAARLGEAGVGPRLLGASLGEASATLVFQRIAGEPLHAYAERVPMAVRRAAAVAVARLISYVHATGLSWNDCREHNVLISHDGRPFLVDFEATTLLPLEDDLHRARFMLWQLCHETSFAAAMAAVGYIPTAELPDVPDQSDVLEWEHVVSLLAAHRT